LHRIVLGLALGVSVAASGCSDNSSGPAEPPPPDLSTPSAAIRSLEDIYSRRLLSAALSVHSSAFHFYPAQPESIPFLGPGDTSWDFARETEILERLLVPERTTWLDQVLLEVTAQDIVDSTSTLTRVSTRTELRYLLGDVLLESSRSFVDFIYEKNAEGKWLLLEQREQLDPLSSLTYGQLKTRVQDPPSVATLVVDADSVDATSAVLLGRVIPNGLPATAFFEYGVDASYDSTTSPVSVGSDYVEHVVQQRVSGLGAATEYHYRIVAQSDWGTSRGGDLTFTTDP
jgi:hypothetical protein